MTRKLNCELQQSWSMKLRQHAFVVLFVSISILSVHAQLIYPSGGSGANAIVSGDFNGDGKLDLLVANDVVSALLRGNGDGTFQPAVSLGPGSGGQSIAMGDFNRDGNLDVVVQNQGGAHVFLGNGHGTFQSPVVYKFGDRFVAVADLNGDGKLDLVTLTQSYYVANATLHVLLGNGDGSFQSAVDYGLTDYSAVSVSVGDVNKDGHLDLVVGDHWVLEVLFGNGDGSFQPPVDVAGGFEASVALGDLNGDGALDMVSTTRSAGVVSALLGAGDGTFPSATTYLTGEADAGFVALRDLNGDGKLDLVTVNGCTKYVYYLKCKTNGALSVMLGNGDGTFRPAVNYDSGGQDPHTDQAWESPLGEAVIADFNGDNKPDIAVTSECVDASCGSGTVEVLLGNGDGSFQGKVINSYFPTSTGLTSSPNPSLYGQPVTFTATVTCAGPVPTGKVTFKQVSIRTLGLAILNNGVATLTTRLMHPGEPGSVQAFYPGDTQCVKSTSPSYSQVVNVTPTTTTIKSSVNPSQVGQLVTFTATVKSNTVTTQGTVTFTASSALLATVTLKSGKATTATSALSAGSTTITATYNGNGDFHGSAASLVQTVH
jgi:Bacterial Ig-like domain (group 3)/FG-GAP-like repeat